jgi:hypothetical protein
METPPPADDRPAVAAPEPRRAASAAPALRARFNRLLTLAILLPALVYGSLQLAMDYRANLAHQDEQLRLAT